jgi:hypothetical protein
MDSEIPDQRPPKPEDRSGAEDIDDLIRLELGDGTFLVTRTRWYRFDDWRWIDFGDGLEGSGCWANFGRLTYCTLPPRIEGTPTPPKRSWLARLFGR